VHYVSHQTKLSSHAVITDKTMIGTNWWLWGGARPGPCISGPGLLNWFQARPRPPGPCTRLQCKHLLFL